MRWSGCPRAKRRSSQATRSPGWHCRSGLPGLHVRNDDRVVRHFRRVAEQAAQVEIDALARVDVGGTGRPALLAGDDLARGILRVDADLGGGGFAALVHEVALHAETRLART